MESAKLMHTAREVNIYKTLWVLEKIKNAIINYTSVKGLKPKIACLGLAFKPNIDDLRESKAIEIAENLNAEGYEVYAVEPNIHEHKNLYVVNLSEALEKADIICILVKHREFVRSDIKKKLKEYNALDFCGALL